MTSINKPESVRAVCFFSAQQLLPLLDAFSKEIEGVKTAQDSEHIHRMRVASRRLRAALPLFASCFPEKRYRRWMQEIQMITRALGDARDTDVQIAFITKLIKQREAGLQNKNPEIGSPLWLKSDVEMILVLQLQKKRSNLQTAVVSDLEKLETTGIIDEMRTFFHTQIKEVKRSRNKSPLHGIPPMAADRISRRLNSLVSYEQWVHNPAAVAEHHAMRIAAKKLRYTMEVYAPLYRFGLKKYLVRIKRIQAILGDLHDCDVWIDIVMVMLMKERSRFPVKDSAKNKQTSRVAGYEHFLSERQKERKRLYRIYVRYWESLGRSGIWDDLRQALTEGRKRKFSFLRSSFEEAVRVSVSSLANQFPKGTMHCRSVTALALTIFDDLADLHRMDAHDRFLLECACTLHDIGWKYGHKGHAKKSAEMILSDEHLLFDILDRGIIAMVSRAHRGKVRFESNGIFSLLRSDERVNVMALASIIRIADGLDYLHKGSIESVHCTPGPDMILIEVSSNQNASAEMERARLKSELFSQVFNRNMVIR
jgi:CHAD domain-containing protein